MCSAALVDPSFHGHWGEAERLGLIRGAYHVARPELSSGGQQALHFAANSLDWRGMSLAVCETVHRLMPE